MSFQLLRPHDRFLAQRCRIPELMDDATLDPAQHLQALRGLERINTWSLSAQAFWRSIRSFAMRRSGTLRILDVACGAGDVAIAVWRAAHRWRLPLSIEGCDSSPRAVAYATQRTRQIGAPVRFFEFNALAEELPAGYDVMMSSLFLHHLDDADAVSLLRRMGRAAGAMVLVSDLVRSWTGLALAHVGTRALSRSPVVHVDGPRSVRAAFTCKEAQTLAVQAGLREANIARQWPCRYLLTWNRHP